MGWTGSTGGSAIHHRSISRDSRSIRRRIPSIDAASTLVGTTSLPRPSWSLAIGSAGSRRAGASASPRRSPLGAAPRAVAGACTGKTYRSIFGPDTTGGYDDGQDEDQIRTRTSPTDAYHDGRRIEIGWRWQEAPGRSPAAWADPSSPTLRDRNGGLTLIERLRAAGHDVRRVFRVVETEMDRWISGNAPHPRPLLRRHHTGPSGRSGDHCAIPQPAIKGGQAGRATAVGGHQRLARFEQDHPVARAASGSPRGGDRVGGLGTPAPAKDGGNGQDVSAGAGPEAASRNARNVDLEAAELVQFEDLEMIVGRRYVLRNPGTAHQVVTQ